MNHHSQNMYSLIDFFNFGNDSVNFIMYFNEDTSVIHPQSTFGLQAMPRCRSRK